MPIKREADEEEAPPFFLPLVAAMLELALLVFEVDEEEEPDEVVVALVDSGNLLILLVLAPKSKKLPSLASVTLVPSVKVIKLPGVNVVPDPRSYMVLPLRIVAAYMWPSIVRAGASVMGPGCARVEDWPLTTMIPELVLGSENVVPETTRVPPAVRVYPGPSIKDATPFETLAMMV